MKKNIFYYLITYSYQHKYLENEFTTQNPDNEYF